MKSGKNSRKSKSRITKPRPRKSRLFYHFTAADSKFWCLKLKLGNPIIFTISPKPIIKSTKKKKKNINYIQQERV